MAGKPAILKIETRADTSQARGELGGFQGFVAGITAGVTGFAIGALHDVGDFVIGFAGDVIDAGVQAEEAVDHLTKVFQDNALLIIEAWAGVSAQTFGVTSTEFEGMATKMGRALENMGVGQEDAANLTVQVAQSAADLAATYGISWSDAFDLLEKAALGKFKAIGQYTGAIDSDQLQAAADALDAGNGAFKDMPLNEQATARLNLVMDKLGGTTGAFADHAETIPGKMEQANLKFEETKKTIGEKLMPILQELLDGPLTTLTNWLTDHQEDIGRWAQSAADGLKKVSDWVVEHKDGIKTFFDDVQTAIGILGKSYELFAIGAVGVYNIIAFIGRGIVDVWNFINDHVGQVVDFLIRQWNSLNNQVVALWDVWNFISGLIVGAWDWVKGEIDKTIRFIEDRIQNLKNILGDVSNLSVFGVSIGDVGHFLLGNALAPGTVFDGPRIERALPVGPVTIQGAVTADQVVAALAQYSKSTGSLQQAGIRIA